MLLYTIKSDSQYKSLLKCNSKYRF